MASKKVLDETAPDVLRAALDRYRQLREREEELRRLADQNSSAAWSLGRAIADVSGARQRGEAVKFVVGDELVTVRVRHERGREDFEIEFEPAPHPTPVLAPMDLADLARTVEASGGTL